MKSEKPWFKAYYIFLILILISLLQPTGGTWWWVNNIRWFYVLIVSFLLSNLLTPIIIKIAWLLKILDYPDKRKLHGQPIPRIGGLAIFIAFLITITRNFQFSTPMMGLIIGCSIIYLMGLIDDIRPLSATVRLVAQVAASLVVISNGVILTIVPTYVPGAQIISILITILWLVGVANALNFLDGVDGLATSMVAVCSLLFFLIAWPTSQTFLAYVTISLLGASLGFLPYNWKPAKVFLGDSGATFLGFTLAGIAVMGSWAENNSMVALSTPLLILSIPIFDMIYTTISRVKSGVVRSLKEWLEYVGRDHFHHRLMRIGFSEKRTVYFILILNLCFGFGALVIRDTGTKGSLLMLGQSILIFLIIVALMILGQNKEDKL